MVLPPYEKERGHPEPVEGDPLCGGPCFDMLSMTAFGIMFSHAELSGFTD